MKEFRWNLGSSRPLSFLSTNKIDENICHDSSTIKLKDEKRCLCCEATEHLLDLSEIDLDHPDTDLVSAIKEMQGALIWIIENMNWPAGEKW